MKINAIYYADDDLDDLQIFRESVKILAEKKAKEIILHTFTEGDELLNSVMEDKAAGTIIFLDINMPGKNGFEVLSEIRKEKELDHTPVIMYSTSSDLKMINRSREMGANLYVIKPDYFTALSMLIEKILDIDWSKFVPDDHNFILIR